MTKLVEWLNEYPDLANRMFKSGVIKWKEFQLVMNFHGKVKRDWERLQEKLKVNSPPQP